MRVELEREEERLFRAQPGGWRSTPKRRPDTALGLASMSGFVGRRAELEVLERATKAKGARPGAAQKTCRASTLPGTTPFPSTTCASRQ